MTATTRSLGGLVALCLLAPTAAEAADLPTRLVVASGVNLSKTTWRGDAGAQSSLELALMPSTWIGFYFLGRLGAGIIDERLLTYVSAGARFSFTIVPNVDVVARIAISHQHEETLHVVAEDPAGAIFGIGDGIRHRGGGEAAAGMLFTLAEADDLQVFVSFEGSAVLFPDDRGPVFYGGIASALGLSYAL
jgi:hypothetical protein